MYIVFVKFIIKNTIEFVKFITIIYNIMLNFYHYLFIVISIPYLWKKITKTTVPSMKINNHPELFKLIKLRSL